MAKKSKVAKHQALVRFRFDTSETYIDLRGAVVSEDLAYRIYKMILDDQGKSGAPDLESIFGKEIRGMAVPAYPAYVTFHRDDLKHG